MKRYPPSPKRLREAAARGELAHSPILSAAAGLTAAAMLARLVDPKELVEFSQRAFAGAMEPIQAIKIAANIGSRVVGILIAAYIAAWLVGLLQTGFRFAPAALGRRRPLQRNWVGWLAAAGILIFLAISLRVISAVSSAESISAAASWTLAVGRSLGWKLMVLMAGFGVLDWWLRRERLRRDLWMSREELERERREEEPSPEVRAEQRRLERDLRQ